MTAVLRPPPGPLRLVVLGGSSSTTPALVDALAARPDAGPGELTLFGRDREALCLMTRYAEGRLTRAGWRVRWTDVLAAALVDATVVLHQIRYGGLAGRAADEALAAGLGVPADETLGPGGLVAGLRNAIGMEPVIRALVERCPDALVLNLVNPLGLSTAQLADAGVPVAGLCELPAVTVAEACDVLGVPVAGVRWRYVGLNHRGFVLRIERHGRDLLPELPGRLGGDRIGGLDGDTIAALGALPTKYHALHLPGAVAPAGRATVLQQLRERLLTELRDRPDRTPPSLRTRPAQWYAVSVVPFLAALSSAEPSPHVVNLPAADGLVREGWASVSATGVAAEPPSHHSEVPLPVRRWLRRFDDQERAALAAARRPLDRDRIAAALGADPLLPPTLVAEATAGVARQVAGYAAATSRS